MRDLFIGCDIGTSSTKTVITDINGKQYTYATASYGIIQKHDGWAEQNPMVWVDACLSTIKEAVSKVDPKRIAGLCISALYGGTGVICDSDYEIIRPAIIWMDQRAEKETADIKEKIGEQNIYDITNNGVNPYFGYVKLLWVKNNEPENWEKIKHIIPIHSYIVYLLTGKETTDYSAVGNFAGIYDIKNSKVSKEMCEKLELDYNWFCSDIYAPEDIVGNVKETFLEKLGLDNSVPVCAGTVDCISSMLSAGIVEEGDNAAVLGTSLNWGYIHKGPFDDSDFISMPYCIDPKNVNYTYGGSQNAGALPRWFMKTFIKDESSKAYKELEGRIEKDNIPAGSDGLILLPYFMGERTPIWDNNATGVFFGLTLNHDERHMFNSILESVSYSLKHIMEHMEREDTKINKITLVGGGAKSKLWRQIMANVIGLPVITPTNPVEAPLGDAFLVGKGLGLISEYKDIKEWIEFEKPVLPDLEKTEQYEKFFEIYKNLYINLKDVMKSRKKLL